MDPISLGMMALSAGSGIGKYLSGGGKKASYNLNLPSYQASQYDAPASQQLFTTLQNRVAGKDVGYSPEDLATMNAQAVDQSTQAGNEYTNRAMAGRGMTGGMSKGGTNVVREKALMYGGGLKSEALRDIGIKNAVQKRQEINAAIPQEQTFLTDERSQAERLYQNELQKSLLQKEESDKVEAYNNARSDYQNQGMFDMLGGIGSGYLQGQTGTKNVNPFQYLMGGGNSANSGGMDIGKYLSYLMKKGGTSAPSEGVMG